MADKALIASLRRWKRRFGLAGILFFLLAWLFAYLADLRVSDFTEGASVYVAGVFLLLGISVFFSIMSSSDRYMHDPRLPLKWSKKLSNQGNRYRRAYRYRPVIESLLLLQVSSELIKPIFAHLRRTDAPGIEGQVLLVTLGALSIALIGLMATSLFAWWTDRRAYFSKRSAQEEQQPSAREEQGLKAAVAGLALAEQGDPIGLAGPAGLIMGRDDPVGFLKFVGAMFVFGVIYLFIILIAFVIVEIVFRTAGEYWVATVPYLISVMAGLLGVFAGLSAARRLFSSVRPRRVARIFIVVLSLYWGLQFVQLFADLVWRADSPPLYWTATSLPHFVQAIAAVSLAWKMTADGGGRGKDRPASRDNQVLG